MSKIKLLSVDMQHDFSAEGGVCYLPHPSVGFVHNTLIPFIRNHNIKIAEIISDYRQPRPGDRGDCCHPGEWGFESEIPADILESKRWIKCMNSPIWIRENGGDYNEVPGLPYQDPQKFSAWLEQTIGKPENVDRVVIFGLTLDCCVLCAAQELNWRGYKVNVLTEATDPYSGNTAEKELILHNPPLTNWADPISWESLQTIY